MELDNIFNRIYNCLEVTQYRSFEKAGVGGGRWGWVNHILEAFISPRGGDVLDGGGVWSEFLLGVSIGSRVSKSSALPYN